MAGIEPAAKHGGYLAAAGAPAPVLAVLALVQSTGRQWQPHCHCLSAAATVAVAELGTTGATPPPVLAASTSRGSGTPLPLPPTAATIAVVAAELCLAAAGVTPAVLAVQVLLDCDSMVNQPHKVVGQLHGCSQPL
ncbi:hypothetical protein K439DRAFT_1615573 [Ramaria rubella]|nr:hypothetical protein K439DRAFT_1615573 [Ramaria rubella]